MKNFAPFTSFSCFQEPEVVWSFRCFEKNIELFDTKRKLNKKIRKRNRKWKNLRNSHFVAKTTDIFKSYRQTEQVSCLTIEWLCGTLIYEVSTAHLYTASQKTQGRQISYFRLFRDFSIFPRLPYAFISLLKVDTSQ